MSDGNQERNDGAFIRVAQPWNTAALAPLYDAFLFEDDLPLYMHYAAEQAGDEGHILEVACGSGRVLVPLARAGYSLTGVDASPYMLALAREKLRRAGSEAESRGRLVQADMRSFELEERFDLAFIAVKSFSYLTTREEQQQTLCNVTRHLREGGIFILDLMNPSPAWLSQPDGSVRQDLAQAVPEKEITVVRTETWVSTDLASQVRVIRSAYEVIERDGSMRKYYVEWPYRYTYRFEAELLLERAGFRIEALYGGYRGEAFTSDAGTMLFVARREG